MSDLKQQLRRKQYGLSSGKVSNEQLGMFDEFETEALSPELGEGEGKVTVPSHERKRGKRLKLPKLQSSCRCHSSFRSRGSTNTLAWITSSF